MLLLVHSSRRLQQRKGITLKKNPKSAESDQGLLASAVMHVAETPAGEEDMDYDSDCTSISGSHLYNGDLYTLEEISGFLNENSGKYVSDYFPHVEKCI